MASNLAPPIAVPTMIKSRNTITDRAVGSDIIESINIDPNVAPGTVLASITITPDMTQRLERTCSRFQRVVWLQQTFRVDPGFPSTTGGHFAVAYVRDPEDQAPAASSPLEIMSWVAAQRISAQGKWWQPITLTVPANGDKLYTSQGSDLRLYSPGKLVIICIGTPAQAGSVSVWFDWHVSLAEPSIERPRDDDVMPIFLKHDVRLTHYPYDATYTCLRRPASTFPILDPGTHDTESKPYEVPGTAFEEFPIGSYFRCEHPLVMACQYKSGSGEVSVPYIARYYKRAKVAVQSTTELHDVLIPVHFWTNDKDKSFIWDDFGYVNGASPGQYWSDVYTNNEVIPIGTKFWPFDPSKVLEPEFSTFYHAGKKVMKPTGRVVERRKPVEIATLADLLPRFNLASSIPLTLATGSVVNVEAASPLPVSFDGKVGVSISDAVQVVPPKGQLYHHTRNVVGEVHGEQFMFYANPVVPIHPSKDNARVTHDVAEAGPMLSVVNTTNETSPLFDAIPCFEGLATGDIAAVPAVTQGESGSLLVHN